MSSSLSLFLRAEESLVCDACTLSYYVVVTDAGGVGVLLADATDSYHMNLANFDPKTKEAFKKVMPPFYICNNPMDLTGSASMDDFIKATNLALDDPNIDSIIFAIQPGAPNLPSSHEIADIVQKHFGPGKTKKPLVVLAFGGKHPCDDIIRGDLTKAGMAVFSAPTDAMRVLSKLADYKDYLDRTAGRSKVYFLILNSFCRPTSTSMLITSTTSSRTSCVRTDMFLLRLRVTRCLSRLVFLLPSTTFSAVVLMLAASLRRSTRLVTRSSSSRLFLLMYLLFLVSF